MNDIYDAALALLRQDIGYNDSESVKDKVDKVSKFAIESVKSAYGWSEEITESNVPEALKPLVVCAIARELAMPITGRTEDLKSLDALYQQKLNEAKIADFEKSVKEESDDFTLNVISTITAVSASSDKQAVFYSYANMKKRINAAKSLAKSTIKAAHEWSEDDVSDHLLALATAVGVAGTFGADANQVTLLTQRYEKALADEIAKDMDLETQTLRESTQADDIFASRVIDLLHQYWCDADGKYANGQSKPSPRGIATLVKHIDAVKKTVREEILLTHDWSFAKREQMCVASIMMNDGRYRTQIPGDAVRVISCIGHDGGKVETVMRDGLFIISREAIERIVYICDVDDDSEWSPLARRAYERKVAATVAMGDSSLAANAQRISQLSQLAEKAIQDARTADARQTHTGSGAYGRNYLYDKATGKR